MVKKERFGVSLDKTLVETMEEAMKRVDAKNRSDFISLAIEYYVAHINSKSTSRVLTPALESVIGGKIKDTENHLARIIFKQGVEIAMLQHLMAICYNIDIEQLDDIRTRSIRELKRLNGNYNLEDIVAYEELRKEESDDEWQD